MDAAMLPAAFVLAIAVSPPPAVQLERLARLYHAYELPPPPKDAKLLRHAPKTTAFGTPPPRVGFDVSKPTVSYLGRSPRTVFIFRRGLFGCETDTVAPDSVTLIEPDPKTIAPAEVSLPTAIQFHLRGWHELATAVYAQGGDWEDRRPERVLTQAAVRHWRRQFHDPAVDRAKVARRLALVFQTEPDAISDDDRRFHADLIRSLAPSNAKPGTVEADLDELLDVSEAFSGGWCGDDRYAAVVAHGFDAVPALIAHLSDDRLTRSQLFGFVPRWTWFRDYRIHDFAGDILAGLLHHGDSGTAEGVLRAKDARAWWAEAQKAGEEAFAAARVLKAKGDASRPNPHLLVLLERKYPERLPEVFHTLLAERPEMSLEEMAAAVADSTLAVATKRKLFQEAAESNREEWRQVGRERLKAMETVK